MKRTEVIRLMKSLSGGARHEPHLSETHISWVILAGRYAYKIKKPVKFSFVDFSTLEERKYYCEREVTLNRRLAAGMYLGVVPVFRQNNSIGLEEPGTVIDYAVLMKRLDAALEMDKLLEAGKVRPPAVKTLARKIASFHDGAPVISGGFSLETLQKQFDDITSVAASAARYIGRDCPGLISRAVGLSAGFLERHRDRFLERSAAGFVRDVHGDLHCGNIFLYDDPVIFDCIEFNDAFRQIDVLDEAAFLGMDIESYGKKKLSDSFFQNYLGFSGTAKAAENRLLYAYYKLYRASVRAKTAMLKALQPDADKNAAIKDARRYFTLLSAYSANWQS